MSCHNRTCVKQLSLCVGVRDRLGAPAEFVPLNQWRQVVDVNLQGPLAVSQVGFLGLIGIGTPRMQQL
jgi:NAD(P)-dependent dehydrogenase (short-subunit alcohol dehydrogenase family)